MKEAAATGQLLERSEELARIESALGEARTGRGTFVVIEGPAGIGKTALLAAARTAAADGGMRVLRARGTELERDFAFGVVRQLFEPPLAEASELERADLLHARGRRRGRPPRASGRTARRRPRPRQASIPRSRSSTASTGCARTWPPPVRSAWSSTTRTGQTPRPSATWRSCSRVSKSWTSRSSWRPDPREAGTDAELLATVTTDPVGRRDPAPSSHESSALPSSWSRGSVRLRIQSSSTRACAQRAGRRSCCASSWRR